MTDPSVLPPRPRRPRSGRYSWDAATPPTHGLAFERKLYVIRKRMSHGIRYTGKDRNFYVSSLSSRTIVYKGMLTPMQVREFYPDLRDPLMVTAIILFHSRFSTNTFPSWDRAHPYRYVIHNGEINALRGNRNWMKTRQGMLASDLFGDDLPKIFPILDEDGSDTAIFDNCLEFLYLSGRSLPHAMMMMIPEPWEKHESMSDKKRAFYEYHSCLMEPWDGPAHMAFTDGTIVGASLDRNGFRPSRYYVTKDDLVVLASETGVLEIPPERMAFKGRLQPGKMLLIDTKEGRIISDDRGQGQDSLGASLPEVARREPRLHRGPASRWSRASRRRTTRASSGASRPSVTPTTTPESSWDPCRRSAATRSARWGRTPRSRSCPTDPSSSTTTSISSSPR